MQKFLDPETHSLWDSHDFLGTISGCLVTLTFSFVCQGVFLSQNDVWLAHCLMGMLYFTHFLEPPSPCVVYWYAANGGCWKINTNTKASLDFHYWNLPARSVTKIIFTLFQPFFLSGFPFFSCSPYASYVHEQVSNLKYQSRFILKINWQGTVRTRGLIPLTKQSGISCNN